MDLGYRIQDRPSHNEILLLEVSLRNAGASVVCIIDFKSKIVSNKSSDFLEHMDKIEDNLFEEGYIQL
jgi:hypothetical protein